MRNKSIQTHRVTPYLYTMEIGTERWFRVADADSRQVLSPLQSTVEGLDPAAQAGCPLNIPAGVTASLQRHSSLLLLASCSAAAAGGEDVATPFPKTKSL